MAHRLSFGTYHKFSVSDAKSIQPAAFPIIAQTLQQETGCIPIAPRPPGQPDLNVYMNDPDTRTGFNVPGERSLNSKDELFKEITSNDGILGDFNWQIGDQDGNIGNFIPAKMLRSVAGIESLWRQYVATSDGSATLESTGDYGIMQINQGQRTLFEGASSPTQNTNLCNDTRANIAAGATRLKEIWELGRTGPLPVVNNQNPRFTINWYYALSTYNGGPASQDTEPPVGRWVNNPNCDGPLGLRVAYCDGFPNDPGNLIPDYTDSRDPGASWYNLSPAVYPYQERVLYNTQFPRQPTRTQWVGQDIGLRETRVSRRETGIIPVDSLFERVERDANDNPVAFISRAPDLLLFRTSIGVVNQGVFPAEITIEYDLPIEANVTIEILDEDNNTIDILLNRRRVPVSGAAFNVEKILYDGSIGPDYGYRIRAEVNGFEGEYIRPLRIVEDNGSDLQNLIFLPSIYR